VPVFTLTEACSPGDIVITDTGVVADAEGCGVSQTWTANFTDDCGNVAEEVSITYTWTVDEELPTVSISGHGLGGDLGCNPTAIPDGQSLIMYERIIADDNCGVASIEFEAGDIEIDDCGRSITYTYFAIDNCGNETAEEDRIDVTYTWTVDTERPSIWVSADEETDLGCNPETIPSGESLIAKGKVAGMDNCGIMAVDFTTEGDYEGCDRSVTYTYFAKDNCGNRTARQDRISVTYRWTVDEDGPELIPYCSEPTLDLYTSDGAVCPDEATTDVKAGDVIDLDDLFSVAGIDLGAIDGLELQLCFEDGCSEDLTYRVRSVNNSDSDGCERIISIRIEAVDACGNVSEDTMLCKFRINDDIAPVIACPSTDEGSDSIFLGCDPVSTNGIPNAIITSVDYTDNCSESGTTYDFYDGEGVTFNEETHEYSLTRTFSAEDRCGNEGNCSITYTWKIPETETAYGVFVDNDRVSSEFSQCFIPDFSRWGWTNSIYFDAEQGLTSYAMDIYAGASGCNIANGDDAGTVNIEYNEYDSSITFNYNLEGFALSQAHIYVGPCEQPYPTNGGSETVAPGQYTFVDENIGFVENYSVTIPVTGKAFSVIVHAVTSESKASCLTETSADNPLVGNYDGPTIEGCEYQDAEATSSVDFSASPVPFEDTLNVNYRFDYNTDVKIDVYDMRGSLVSTTTNYKYLAGRNGRTTLDMSRLQNAVYLVRVTTNKGTLAKKVISAKK
ncbi:T9SS type A sorting domain-containing protein, partial [Winogradskyella immobilis]